MATQKLVYAFSEGKQIAHDLAISAGPATVYTDRFFARDCEVWNTQMEWTDDSTTLAITVTLWASNKPTPDDSSDDDWVQMTASHGFDGLPGGNPAGGSGKDMVDVSASGALWYRWKFARTAGSGVLQAYVSKRDRR